jgi:hypothetical protein
MKNTELETVVPSGFVAMMLTESKPPAAGGRKTWSGTVGFRRIVDGSTYLDVFWSGRNDQEQKRMEAAT